MKKFLLICLTLITTACTAKDSNYYQSHPKEMQEAINNCPEKQPDQISCAELKEVAFKFNKLANELQSGPQEFGKRIIALQEEIAEHEEQLKKKPDAEAIKKSISSMRQQLAERLIMVKLFESPEG